MMGGSINSFDPNSSGNASFQSSFPRGGALAAGAAKKQ
jgi:hypothetical protein